MISMKQGLVQAGRDATFFVQERETEIASEEGVMAGEGRLLRRLREGDESAFMQLVEQYHGFLLQLARKYVRSYSSAEEVVQETWVGVLQRLSAFEGRSSLKTWIVHILINQACNRARRDQRLVPFSLMAEYAEEMDGCAVEAECFQEAEESMPGVWFSLTEDSHAMPEANMLLLEAQACVVESIEALPVSQRAVMVLCDLEGWRPEEVCGRLGISMANQRVLLHRARAKVRSVLEKYFDER